MRACILSLVQFFVTPRTVAHYSSIHGVAYPWIDSSVHGIFQARILEWVAISSSRRSSRPQDRIHIFCVSYIGRWIFLPLSPLGSLFPLIANNLWGDILALGKYAVSNNFPPSGFCIPREPLPKPIISRIE